MANYNTLEEAEEYFATRMHSQPWHESSEKAVALADAHRRIDRMPFTGEKSVFDQADAFPRDGVDTPQAIKDAELEVAIALMIYDPEVEAEFYNAEDHKFASVGTSINTSYGRPWVIAGLYSKTAWDLLLPYLKTQLKVIRT